jgi:hypothetical protein
MSVVAFARQVNVSYPKSSPTYRIGAIMILNLLTIEQESDRLPVLALTLTESVHQFLQLSGALDLEEDLIVAVGDFDVEMFRWRRRVRLRAATGRSIFRHCVGWRIMW